MAETKKKGKIGIIGSGLIGRSWAMLFAGAGYRTMLFDIVAEQVQTALTITARELKQLESDNHLRGWLNSEQQFACISGTTNLKTLVQDTFYIQECIPEELELKQVFYKKLDKVLEPEIIVASSTSTFLPSLLSETLKHRENMVVAHPVNPPYYVPLVEIVPAPWTKIEVVNKTRDLMKEIGQTPVTLSREIEGFALNRIQYAILNETWRLVEAGILNVKDIDCVMSDGLGMRYAFLGPLETAHLNAEGITNYLERYCKTMYDVSKTMGEVPKMEGNTANEISKQLEVMVPLERLNERRSYRNTALMKLSLLKKNLKQESKSK